MKLIRLVFILIFLSCSNIYAEDICGHVDIKWLSSQAPFPEKVDIVHKKKVENLCEVVLLIEADLIPLYCGKDYILSGQMIKNKKFLTEKRLASLKPIAENARKKADKKRLEKKKKRDKFFKENISELENFVSFKIGPEKAKKSIYFITDPDCSHCKSMIRDLRKIAFENNILVKAIIYPVLGSKSETLAYQAMCKKYNYKEYMEIKEGKDPIYCREALDLIVAEKRFFKKADLNFVPVILSEKGDWVVEGEEMDVLKIKLGIKD